MERSISKFSSHWKGAELKFDYYDTDSWQGVEQFRGDNEERGGKVRVHVPNFIPLRIICAQTMVHV